MKFTHPELTKERKKEIWGDGPWVDEPDYLEFNHKGINCVVRRIYTAGFGGYLGAYIQISKEQPLHVKKDAFIKYELSSHKKLFITYQNGEDWIGFHCGHSYDIIPSIRFVLEKSDINEDPRIQENREISKKFKQLFPDNPIINPTYKTWDFVVEETKKLAEQIREYK